jgi:hypothetical protein
MIRILLLFTLLTGCAATVKFDNDQFICNDANDQPITIIDGYEAKYLEELAYATWNEKTRQREIYLSDTIYKMWPDTVVRFVAYHECAHHQLDHIDTSETPAPWLLWSEEVYLKEQDADCEAANTFYALHGEDAFNDLIDDLKASGSNTASRIKRIKHCIN